MVATPDSLEHPSSPALPASAGPTSLDHGSTMEITSALPDSHLDEAQPPDSPVTPEKEKESDGSTEGPPPMSSPVQFIGINYFPPSPIDVQTTSQPQPPDATPWESGAVSPLSEDYVVVGLPTFPPKIPCVCFPGVLLLHLPPPTPPPPLIHVPVFRYVQLTHSRPQHQESKAWGRTGFILPFWAAGTRFGVLYATYGTDWGTSPARNRPRRTRLYRRRDCAIFICLSHGA